MFSDPVFVYVDESGDPNLDMTFDNATHTFTIISVIVQQSKLEAVKKRVEEIRSKYFQKGEMKSSSVGRNERRRARIISEIAQIEGFTFARLTIDKHAIRTDKGGLRFIPIFKKYFWSLISKVVFDAYSNVSVISDNLGRESYMAEFIQYIEGKFPGDLFRKSKFTFEDSKNDVLLQLSDFIAGSVAYVLEPGRGPEEGTDILAPLKDKCIYYKDWPNGQVQQGWDEAGQEHGSSAVDNVIHEQATQRAIAFLRRSEGAKSIDVFNQRQIATELLIHHEASSVGSFLSTSYLAKTLEIKEMTYEATLRYLRTSIIAALRDEQLLISPGPNGGYRFPSTRAELTGYAKITDRNIEPQIYRLGIARQAILLATHGEFDILKEDQYDYIRQFLDSRAMPSHPVDAAESEVTDDI